MSVGTTASAPAVTPSRFTVSASSQSLTPTITTSTPAPHASAPAPPSAPSLPMFGSASTPATTTVTMTAPPSLFLSTKPSSSTLASSTLSSQPQLTPATLSFGFSVPASSSASTQSAAIAFASSSVATTQPLSTAGAASTAGTTSSTVSTVQHQTPKLPSEITGKTVEEIIKDWNTELLERTGRFHKQACAIAEWDRRILQNRDVLIRLETEVGKVVETQSKLERELELIETHQQEVDKALQSIEEEAEHIYKDERGLMLQDEAASTRDSMYEQAEFIEREMERMAEQIKSIIQTFNASQGGGDLDMIDAMTPIDVVARILNNQLSSLMWIDEKATEFSTRIQKLANRGAAADRDSSFWWN
ncbi:hypothetical protein QJS04_geneDACA007557 [Acorus gramineus]|uniref:Nucleoporin NSP1-like C-terminal domain-containing protein n=1 Tax=Acorus gramineus TaxID=55184 RepID=A0AAV9B2A2_ACOGR|nr:hypothetical protein QJS04_geneDACA007557 [Acorus gramineus]